MISGTVAWYLTSLSATTAREHCHIAGFDKYTPAIFLSYCCGLIYVGRVPRKRQWSPDWKESKQRNGINASFDRVRFRFLLPRAPFDITHLRQIYGQAIFYMLRRNNTIALSSRALPERSWPTIIKIQPTRISFTLSRDGGSLHVQTIVPIRVIHPYSSLTRFENAL